MSSSFVTASVTAIRRMLPGSARLHPDAGMATAEYAVATVAACGFGGILYKLLSSETVLNLLTDLIKQALGFVL